MYCSRCGKELEVGANFCSNCGSRVLGREEFRNTWFSACALRVKALQFIKVLLPLLVAGLAVFAIFACAMIYDEEARDALYPERFLGACCAWASVISTLLMAIPFAALIRWGWKPRLSKIIGWISFGAVVLFDVFAFLGGVRHLFPTITLSLIVLCGFLLAAYCGILKSICWRKS